MNELLQVNNFFENELLQVNNFFVNELLQANNFFVNELLQVNNFLWTNFCRSITSNGELWKVITALCEQFSLFAVDISLQYVDFCFCYEVFLLYRLAITLYYMVIQLC